MLDRKVKPSISSIDNFDIQQPIRRVLTNGIPLTVLRSNQAEVVRVDVVFKAGRWLSDLKLQALFTNRLLREGSDEFTSKEIAEKLDYYGAWIELSCGVTTATVSLYSLNKYLYETIEILASIIKHPLFPEDRFKTIVENNLQNFLINCTKTNFVASRMLLNGLYGHEHPNGRYAVYNDYKRLSVVDLKDFFVKYYCSNNCYIYLSGNVTEEVIRVVDRFLGIEPFGLNSQMTFDKEFSLPATCPEKRMVFEVPQSEQDSVYLGMLTIDSKHPDFFPLKVLLTLFGGYFGSRLMTNIREMKGYTYGIYSSLTSYPSSSMIVINADCAEKYVEPLIEEVYHEIEMLRRSVVPMEELNIVKNYMIGDLSRSFDSVFTAIESFVYLDSLNLERNYFSKMYQAIVHVSPEDILRVSNLYLCKENLKEVISGKLSGSKISRVPAFI